MIVDVHLGTSLQFLHLPLHSFVLFEHFLVVEGRVDWILLVATQPGTSIKQFLYKICVLFNLFSSITDLFLQSSNLLL